MKERTESKVVQVVLGGRNDTNYFDDMWEYNVKDNSWQHLEQYGKSFPTPRDHFGGFYHDGLIYIYGAFHMFFSLFSSFAILKYSINGKSSVSVVRRRIFRQLIHNIIRILQHKECYCHT